MGAALLSPGIRSLSKDYAESQEVKKDSAFYQDIETSKRDDKDEL